MLEFQRHFNVSVQNLTASNSARKMTQINIWAEKDRFPTDQITDFERIYTIRRAEIDLVSNP